MSDASILAAFILGRVTDIPPLIMDVIDKAMINRSNDMLTPTRGNIIGIEIPDSDAPKIREYCEQKMSDQEIADIYGCDQSTVSRFRKKHKIDKDRAAIQKKDLGRVRELVAKGKTDEEIGKIFGIGFRTVERFRHDYKISRPSTQFKKKEEYEGELQASGSEAK